MTENGKKINNIGNDIFRIAAIIIFSFFTIPVYLRQVTGGLDPSWIYGINVFNDMGFKYGRDLAFTYGPLGFLTNTHNIGNNLTFALIFWGVIFAVHLFLLIYIFWIDRDIKVSKTNIIISLLLLAVSISMAWSRNISAEYYITMIILISLSIAWYSQRKGLFFTIACILTTILLFIKFSGAITSLTAIVLLLALYIFKNKKNGIQLLKIFLIIPIGFVAGYLIYNPSISNMITYIKDAAEISGGYNIAMSTLSRRTILLKALIMLFAYISTIIFIFFINRDTSFYMMIFSGAFFMIFKHGFVRGDDGHTFIFFSGFLMFFSIIILFINTKQIYQFSKEKNNVLIMGMILILAMILPSGLRADNIEKLISGRYGMLISDIGKVIKEPIIGTGQLPKEILDKIGLEPVTIFPQEISFAAYNQITYVPMPIFQAYSAYTPYLDNRNAEFFKSEYAPEYIIFDIGAIDNRIPLVEVPATWDAIYKNYYAVMCEKGLVLLQKEENNLSYEKTEIASKNITKDEIIKIPESEKNVIMTVDMKLNLLGKLCKIFFRIPEVTMKAVYSNGEAIAGRIIPENLSNGIIINNLPNSSENTILMLNNGKINSSVAQIRFYGVGLKYYNNNLKVTFETSGYEKPKKELPQDVFAVVKNADEYLKSIQKSEEEVLCSIDRINNMPVTEGLKVSQENGLKFTGWAVDSANQTVGQEVYIKIGDKLYAGTRTDRGDVANYLGKPDYKECGFAVNIEPGTLPYGEQDISFIMINKDKNKWYEVSKGSINIVDLTESSGEAKLSSFKMKNERLSGFAESEEQTESYIDDMDGESFKQKMTINQQDGITIKGWAVDSANHTAAQEIYILIGDRVYEVKRNERADVAKHFGVNEYLNSGFEFSAEPDNVPKGKTEIGVIVVNKDKKIWYNGIKSEVEIK